MIEHDYQRPDHRFSDRVLEVYASAKLPKTLTIRAATETDPTQVMIYDEIGKYGISAKSFHGAMTAVPDDAPITVRINSPGGDVWDAFAIYNSLQNRKGDVHTVVDGIAASAASLIALAGSKLSMHETSMLMIHNAHTTSLGDRHAMTETADILAKVDQQLAAIYAQKIGGTVEDAHAMMDAETWMTSSDAIEAGLCDDIIDQNLAEVAAIATGADLIAETQRDLRIRKLRLIKASN